MNDRSTQTDGLLVEMGDRKIRCPKTTPVERALLYEVIKQYDNTLGCKEKGHKMSQKKRRDWDEIARQFNALNKDGSGFRTGIQLQRLYQNRWGSRKNFSRENSFGEMSQFSDNVPTSGQNENGSGGGSYNVPFTNNHALATPDMPMLQDAGDAEPFVIPDVDVLIKEEPTEGNSAMETSNITYADSTLNMHDQESPLDMSSGSRRRNNITLEDRCSQGTIPDEGTKDITSLREKYYETKLINAQMETQCLKTKYKMDVYKFKLKTKILKLQLSKLQENYNA